MVGQIGLWLVVINTFFFFFALLTIMSWERTRIGDRKDLDAPRPISENPTGFEPLTAEQQDDLQRRVG